MNQCISCNNLIFHNQCRVSITLLLLLYLMEPYDIQPLVLSYNPNLLENLVLKKENLVMKKIKLLKVRPL